MINNFLVKVKKKLKLTNDINEYRKKGIQIGDNCHFFNCQLDEGHGYLIEIGNNCTLTNCTILSHDASTQIWFKKTKIGCVKIGDNTFVGWGSIVLPNVEIGANCIIGAGSVVTQDIPANSVAAGNPCKVICSISEFKEKHKEGLKNKPVFNTHYSEKTNQEKEKEKELLKNSFGYDK